MSHFRLNSEQNVRYFAMEFRLSILYFIQSRTSFSIWMIYITVGCEVAVGSTRIIRPEIAQQITLAAQYMIPILPPR